MENEDQNINSDVLPEDEISFGDDESVNETVGFASKIGQALNKQFKDDESALKAVQDTFKYVSGSAKARKVLETVMQNKGFKTEEQAIDFINNSVIDVEQKEKAENNPNLVTREEFERANFYNDNPSYKPYKNLIETYQKANPDKSRSEILELEDFKDAFEKVKSHDETKKQKSILHSNSKVGMGIDKMTKAMEADKSGNRQQGEKLVTEAVIDAFGLNK